jgi:hypothetical protein
VSGTGAACRVSSGGIELEVRGRKASVKITADQLNRQPNGWLAAWAGQLDRQNCLSSEEGMKLAERIAEAVPLDPSGAFRLLSTDDRQSGAVDILPNMTLQVVSPFWREGASGEMPVLSTVAGSDSELTVTLKSSDDLLGYETTRYSIRGKGNGRGYFITPTYASRTVQGVTEVRAQPSKNYFSFGEDAGFYRLFYESTQTAYTALVIAARTPAELDQLTRDLAASGAEMSCDKLSSERCAAIPKDVAVNPMIAVTVNGVELLMISRASVANAITAAGERQPRAVLADLKITKPWNGRMVPVVFDHNDGAILGMALRGGEIISWR